MGKLTTGVRFHEADETDPGNGITVSGVASRTIACLSVENAS